MTVMGSANWDRMSEVMDWFADVGVRSYSINFQQPQGRGGTIEQITGDQFFEGTRQIFEHMAKNRVHVYEALLGQQVERFVEGRVLGQQGCWEFECQAGRSYVSVDHHGRIHACGTDVTNHVLGQIQDGYIDRAHYDRKMKRLHHKGDWVLRCFDCNARRICDHSCPTADFASMAYKEAECQATKKLWNYFCANKDRVREVYRVAAQRGLVQRKPLWAIPAVMKI
jgi:radical SAM protein with 4Fe4S-binding SPASM domain